MQKLNHPNIVKYIDTIRTKSYLYIVLEYMENGSLANVIKKFGSCSESLTAIYITKVLRGLKYLHEQGVLHRDIKAANILTAKDGAVKLADFGVAMKLNEAHAADEQYIVGSPYWMAPEIIEMSTPTAACDIWSVGCVVIELLTTKPPYFHLNQATALFRIVQDDYPPIPEGISQALRDFLFNCFQKEPDMRSSALKLLEHPWLHISSSLTSLEQHTSNIMSSVSQVTGESTDVVADADSIVNTIKMHHRELFPTVDGIAMISSKKNNDLSKPGSIDKNDDFSGNRSPTVSRSASNLPFSPNKGRPGIAAAPGRSEGSGNPASAKKKSGINTTRGRSPSDNATDFIMKGLVRPGDVDRSSPASFQKSPAVLSDSKSDALETSDSSNHPSNSKKSSSSPDIFDDASDDSPDENWDAEMDNNFADSFDSNDPKASPRLPSDSKSSDSKSKQPTPPDAKRNAVSRSSSASFIPKAKSSRLDSTSSGNIAHALVVGESLTSSSQSALSLTAASRGFRSIGGIVDQAASAITLSHYQEQPDEESYDDMLDAFQEVASVKVEKSAEPDVKKGSSVVKVNLQKYAETKEFDDEFEIGTLKKELSGGIKRSGLKTPVKPLQMSLSNNDGDFDDLVFDETNNNDAEHGSNNKSFASKLRQKLIATTMTKEPSEDEVDEFLNYQFDEKDFKQNEQKDIHFRRSRDIVDLLGKIRSNASEEDLLLVSNQIISIFDEFPDQREHLITYHGVMPIVDMFEGTPNSSSSVLDSEDRLSEERSFDAASSSMHVPYNIFASYVLLITNKIIEDNVRAQEQLSLVGIIPSVMNMFEKSCQPVLASLSSNDVKFSGASHGGRNIVPFSESQTGQISEAKGNSEASVAASCSPALNRNVDSLTFEAAKFIHQISFSSSLTLQMLVGAGGLGILTAMVSFGARIDVNAAILNIDNSLKFDMRNSLVEVDGESETSSSTGKDEKQNGVDDPLLQDVSFFTDKSATNNNNDNNNSSSSVDSEKCMIIFQMGISCITKVFAVQSSRTRDFCRLFVKLGLLPHLAAAFENVVQIFLHAISVNNDAESMQPRPVLSKSTSESAVFSSLKKGQSGGSMFVSSETNVFVKASSTNTSGSLLKNKGLTDSLQSMGEMSTSDTIREGVYAVAIAELFLKFSRSDSVVVETMSDIDKGVVKTILKILQAPELRNNAETNSLNGNQISTLSQKNLLAHNANNSAFNRRSVKSSGLNPTYVEIIELLLKCLKNLSMEPSKLNDLEKAGTMETLVPLLSGPIYETCKMYILPCIFNMCRINRRRQELSAVLGIVPIFKKVISEGSHLKQFALPNIFDLAHTSNVTRAELWKNDCVTFFVDMLKENYWQAIALNSLAVW